MGALTYAVANGIGGNLGVILVFAAVVALAVTFFMLARRNKVTPDNVNAEWTGGPVSVEVAA